MFNSNGITNYPVNILLLLLVGLSTLAFASYKLQNNGVSLVRNERCTFLKWFYCEGVLQRSVNPGVVYLFQQPRTDTTPSFAPLNTKVEVWLKWSGIPFHRLSNQFLLGSSEGTTPFARYNGKYYMSSDEIIEEIGKKTGKYTENPEEKELRKWIDDKLFKIVVLDRVAKDGEKSGLDWMVNDDGIAEQFLPILVNKQEFTVDVKLDNTEYKMKLNAASYRAYFNAWTYLDEDSNPDSYSPKGKCHGDVNHIDGCKKAKTEFLEKFLKKVNGKHVRWGKETKMTMAEQGQKNSEIATAGSSSSHIVIKEEVQKMFTMEHWDQFNEQFRPIWVQGALTNVFRDREDLNGKANLEKKLNEFLANNFLDEERTESYASLKDNGDAIFDLLQEMLKPIFKRLEGNLFEKCVECLGFYKKKPKFLFGEHSTPADASLFGMLMQFFHVPLTIPQLREYFKPDEGEEEGGIMDQRVELLWNYLEHGKRSLGLTDEVWAKMTRKPWPLNYEHREFHSRPFFTEEEVEKYNTAKYEGPFVVHIDDELKNFMQKSEDEKTLKSYPEVITAALQHIKAYAQRHQIEPNNQKAMLEVMAAYLCHLGPAKVDQTRLQAPEIVCARRHMRKAKTYIGHGQLLIGKTRELVNNAVVAYNEQLVKEAVLKEIREISKDPSNESAREVGNEL